MNELKRHQLRRAFWFSAEIRKSLIGNLASEIERTSLRQVVLVLHSASPRAHLLADRLGIDGTGLFDGSGWVSRFVWPLNEVADAIPCIAGRLRAARLRDYESLVVDVGVLAVTVFAFRITLKGVRAGRFVCLATLDDDEA